MLLAKVVLVHGTYHHFAEYHPRHKVTVFGDHPKTTCSGRKPVSGVLRPENKNLAFP